MATGRYRASRVYRRGGQQIGPSNWRTATQVDFGTFAELSGDDQWIHVDVERARSRARSGRRIAHGNLTLSLVDGFRKQLISHRFRSGRELRMGQDQIPAPVPADSRARAGIVSVEEVGGG